MVSAGLGSTPDPSCDPSDPRAAFHQRALIINILKREGRKRAATGSPLFQMTLEAVQ